MIFLGRNRAEQIKVCIIGLYSALKSNVFAFENIIWWFWCRMQSLFHSSPSSSSIPNLLDSHSMEFNCNIIFESITFKEILRVILKNLAEIVKQAGKHWSLYYSYRKWLFYVGRISKGRLYTANVHQKGNKRDSFCSCSASIWKDEEKNGS